MQRRLLTAAIPHVSAFSLPSTTLRCSSRIGRRGLSTATLSVVHLDDFALTNKDVSLIRSHTETVDVAQVVGCSAPLKLQLITTNCPLYVAIRVDTVCVATRIAPAHSRRCCTDWSDAFVAFTGSSHSRFLCLIYVRTCDATRSGSMPRLANRRSWTTRFGASSGPARLLSRATWWSVQK